MNRDRKYIRALLSLAVLLAFSCFLNACSPDAQGGGDETATASAPIDTPTGGNGDAFGR